MNDSNNSNNNHNNNKALYLIVSAIKKSGFIPPISLEDGLQKTLKYEFLEDNKYKKVFFTE